MNILTQSELKKNLHFERGVFYRKSRNKNTGSLDKDGYLIVKINKVNYKAHRLAWLYVYGEFPNSNLDHINGIRTDNRIENLRVCSDLENARNTGLRSDNTSGYKGVSYFKETNKWRAYGSLNGKIIHLGFYNLVDDAAKAYDKFAQENYGEFYKDINKW